MELTVKTDDFAETLNKDLAAVTAKTLKYSKDIPGEGLSSSPGIFPLGEEAPDWNQDVTDRVMLDL